MKKLFLALLMAICATSASAQFMRDTKYLNVSTTGLGLSYQKNHFNFGLEAKGGFFLEDAWMVYGQMGYDLQNVKGVGNDVNSFNIGVGGRYYIHQNGLYLNMGLKFDHAMCGHHATNYVDLTPEVGYCFYLNHYLSVEPAVYYDLCLNKFSEGSKVGLKVGFGYYF